MIRLLFVLLMVIHGLIHVMGFAREWELAEVSQLTGKTLVPLSGGMAKMAGLGWLMACLILLFAAVLFVLKKDWWWMPGVAGVIISQLLIFLYWQDARFGTIANVILLVVILVWYGSWNFNRMVEKEVAAFLPETGGEQEIVTREALAGLPPIVQLWLERSSIVGKPLAQTVHLRQKGEMKTKPDGKWLPVEAEQYIRVEKPGFIWNARIRMGSLLHLSGRDKYEDGKGNMLIKLMSLFTITDSKGPEIDQGTLLRYLAEIIWVPAAAWSDYIRWEHVDSTRARAIMHYGGVTAGGIFEFTPEGDMVGFEAQRYYNRKEGATLETWVISSDPEGFRSFEGVRIPARSSVTWKLEEGDFTWFQLEITGLDYQRPR